MSTYRIRLPQHTHTHTHTYIDPKKTANEVNGISTIKDLFGAGGTHQNNYTLHTFVNAKRKGKRKKKEKENKHLQNGKPIKVVDTI